MRLSPARRGSMQLRGSHLLQTRLKGVTHCQVIPIGGNGEKKKALAYAFVLDRIIGKEEYAMVYWINMKFFEIRSVYTTDDSKYGKAAKASSSI